MSRLLSTRLRRASLPITFAIACAFNTAQAAPTLFTGLDNLDLSAGGAHPNADAAAAAFMLAAGTLLTEDFERFTPGTLPAGFLLGPVTVTVTPLATDFTQISEGVSTYSTFPIDGVRYLETLTNAGSPYLSIGFDVPVRALGFYITDASDWSGSGPPVTNLGIRLFANSGDTEIELFAGTDPATVVNGNVGFFGVIDTQSPITGFSMSNPGPNPPVQEGEDDIGIDRLMIAPVPLPPGLPLLGIALLALVRNRRRGIHISG